MTVKNRGKARKALSEEESPLIYRLTSFGFSHAEASVYLYLIKKGTEAGGSKIAMGAGLHRQYVYIALQKLVSKGLVEDVAHGKQLKYKARPPQIIETLGRKKAIEAGDLAQKLNLVSNIGNEQDFEVIQGKRAIQEYELMYAEHAKEGSEECIIGGATNAFSELMEDSIDEYLEIKRRKGVRVKYLGTEDEKEFYQKYSKNLENQEYRFMKKLPKGQTHMLVREDSVSFYSFFNPPLVYVVKSKQVAENYRAFFEMLWEMGEMLEKRK